MLDVCLAGIFGKFSLMTLAILSVLSRRQPERSSNGEGGNGDDAGDMDGRKTNCHTAAGDTNVGVVLNCEIYDAF